MVRSLVRELGSCVWHDQGQKEKKAMKVCFSTCQEGRVAGGEETLLIRSAAPDFSGWHSCLEWVSDQTLWLGEREWERSGGKRNRGRENSTGAWNLWTQPTSRWTGRHIRDHSPTPIDLCPASCPMKYNWVKGANRSLRKIYGVIRVNEINMHRVINTH